MIMKIQTSFLNVGLRSLAVLMVLGVVWHGRTCFAQTAGTGAISGTVLDQSGALVAGVKIVVTNRATSETRTVNTNVRGAYLVSALLPGVYSVQASRDGFKTLNIPEVTVIVTETTALDLHLEVGRPTEKVIVEGFAEQLQTESSTLGRVTSGDQVRDLPLVTRNYTQIVSLNPGVAADVNDAGAIGRGNLGMGGVPISSNGGTQSDNNVQMNGVGINDLQSSGYFSGGVAIPNPDTIQEFKVQTSQYDASYGRNAGANVDVITKGGTNDFHGAAWEFFRNDDLNANTFFRNLADQPRPALKQNQFGFDFGGPIKHDKLFFFTSYQGTRQRNGLDPNCSSSVTSPALTDDRSAAALGTLFAGQRGAIQDALGGVGPAIASDGSNINPVALALLQMKLPNGQYVIPTPQTVDPTNPSFDAQGFSAFSSACPYSENQFMTNADWQISTKSKLEGRFFFSNSATAFTIPQANLGGGTAPGFPVDLTNNFRNFSLTHTYIFGPNLINRAEIGFHRILGLYQQSQVFSYSQIGATVPEFDDNIPAIALNFGSANGLSLGGNGQTVHLAQNVYTFEDSLTWIHGRHSFRFGAGVSREQLNQVGFHYLAGELFLSWPDFLLGLNAEDNGTAPFAPYGYNTSNIIASVDLPGLFDRAWRVWGPNAYVQDDIKVTSRLTVNLGLRYERLGDIADELGRNSSFDLRLADTNPPAPGSLSGYLVSSNYPGGAVPAGVQKVGNKFGGYGENQNTWNPRVGFAWRLPHTEDLVLRGGYGIYHSRYTGQPFLQLLTGAPFGQIRQEQLGQNADASEQVPFNLNVPTFPYFPAYAPAPSPTLATTIFDPRFQPPMIQQYSLGLQTKLPGGMILDTSFSGARGEHLIRLRDVNQALVASPTNPIRGETTNTLANIPLRVPYEGWDPSQMLQIESGGASWYNAFLVSLNKRFSSGLQFQLSYTFSKSLSTEAMTSNGPDGGESYGDQNDPSQRYGPDLFIRPQRLILNFSYELPGPKERHSFKGQALGGWMVAGVITAQSGHPLTLTYNHFAGKPSIFGSATFDRPSLSGTCVPGNYFSPGSIQSNIGGTKTYINTSCFTDPAVFNPADDPNGVGFGDAGVGILSGPGQQNWDLSIIKRFPVREYGTLEFRSEFFNAFNHPQFGDPDTEFTSTTFGQITTTVVNPRVMQFALKFSF
ncbi:MAG TPA: carboxypeptidase regulatory-like domain-containing protein [Candidatus Eisenbacteria bacterium]|nr:carboxypeptidase regulatory-like domain-containing protein [Candidatus Eisenbacteria bacterium]